MYRTFRSANTVAVLSVFLIAVSGAVLPLSAQNANTTEIAIDGDISDWSDDVSIMPDSAYDEEPGYLGFVEGRAFLNQDALYFIVQLEDASKPFAQFDLFIGVGSIDYLISWPPGSPEGYRADVTDGFQEIGPTQYSLLAYDSSLEVRIDLRDLDIDDPSEVRFVEVVAMYGECCEELWQPTDTILFPGGIPVLAEVDPGRLLSDDPKYELAREFRLLDGYLAENIYDPPLQAPSHVAVGPDGTIVITDWGSGDTLFELSEQGELGDYCPAPCDDNSGIVFDSAGNLFVTGANGILWKIDPSGRATEYAHGFYGYQLDVGPSGAVYGTEGSGSSIQRVSPNGEVTRLATGFSDAIDLAVNPLTEEVYVYDKGDGVIYRVAQNGSKSVLVSDVLREWNYIACSADGSLYFMDLIDGLWEISTRTGQCTLIPWVKEGYTSLHPCDFVFDPQGRIVCVDITFNHVVRFDLSTRQLDVLWLGMGNTRALATDSEERVYIGVSHPSVTGEGQIMRIDENGRACLFAGGLLPDVQGLAIASDGTAYALAMGSVPGGSATRVYEISAAGDVDVLAEFGEPAWELAMDPLTENLWGISPGYLWWVDEYGRRRTLSTQAAGKILDSLAFAPSGALYIVAYPSGDHTTVPVRGGLYRVNTMAGRFEEVADLSTAQMCCPMGCIAGAADGNIYWVGHGDLYLPGHQHDMHMLQITPDGSVIVFAQNLPMDPAGVIGSQTNTDLYFSSGCGVFRIYPGD